MAVMAVTRSGEDDPYLKVAFEHSKQAAENLMVELKRTWLAAHHDELFYHSTPEKIKSIHSEEEKKKWPITTNFWLR